jgi:hypothetical protein
MNTERWLAEQKPIGLGKTHFENVKEVLEPTINHIIG